MPSKKLGLSKTETRETKKAVFIGLIIILSVTIALVIEYIIDDYLGELKIPSLLTVLLIAVAMLVCVSMQSAKTK